MLFNLDLQSWIAIGIFAAEAIAILVSSVIAAKRGKKLDKAQILSLIPFFTRQANALLGAKTGAAKLEFVLSHLHSLCSENNLDYDRTEYESAVEYYLGADRSVEGVSNAKNESQTQKGSEDLFQDSQSDKVHQRVSRFVSRRN